MNQTKKPFTLLVLTTPVLVAIGLILNLLTIMVFSRLKMRKYCMSISMICLAVSDTAVLTISVLLSWIDESFYSLYYLNNTIWCNLHGYVDMVACANSSWIIIVISIERWFAVCKPWQKSRIFTNNRVAIGLLILFLVSVVIFSYFPFSMTVSVNNEYSTYECKIKHPKYYQYLGFISILLIYFFPFVILAILNAMILYRLRVSPFSNKIVTLRNKSLNKSLKGSNNRLKNSSKKCKRDTNNDLPSSNVIGASPSSNNPISSLNIHSPIPSTAHTYTSSSIPPPQIIPIQTTNSKNDRALSVTLLTVSVTFMILTFPFQINWIIDNIDIFKSNLLSLETNQTNSSSSNNQASISFHLINYINVTTLSQANSTGSITNNTNQEFYQISFLIKNMNYVINFFLYSALSTLFRQEFLAIFKESKFFVCTRVITEAKFSKKSSISEIVFPVNSSTNKNGNKKYVKITIEPSNLAKFLVNKKNSMNKSENNDNIIKDKAKTRKRNEMNEKKLLVKRGSIKTIKLKQYDIRVMEGEDQLCVLR